MLRKTSLDVRENMGGVFFNIVIFLSISLYVLYIHILIQVLSNAFSLTHFIIKYRTVLSELTC